MYFVPQADYTDSRYHEYCRATIFADNQGYYWYTTVHPGTYRDRPVQHIHLRVTVPGTQFAGVYQMYFNTDPRKGMASSAGSIATINVQSGRE